MSDDVDEQDNNPLADLDPVFSEPIGTIVKAKPAAKGRQPLAPVLGLTPEQEKIAAGGVGAIAAPVAQRMFERVIPPADVRAAQGVKAASQEVKTANLLRQLREEQLLAAGFKPSDLVTAQDTAGTKWMRNWAGVDKPITGGVPQASAAYNRMKGQGPVTSKMTQRWGPMPAGEPGKPAESLVDRLLRQSSEAEAAAAQRTAATEAAETAAKTRLAQATPGPLSAVRRGLQGPLAGGFAGLSFYEAYQRYLAGDHSAAVLEALGGVGGLMTMVPGLQLPGAALAGGAAGARYIQEQLRNPESEPLPAATMSNVVAP
jgi:hypothetical protein